MAKWLPPYGFTCKVHHMDARVGGTFRMSFTNFTTGNGHSFGGVYLELVPHKIICYSDRFDDANLPGEMKTTVTLTQVSCCTEIAIVQEGLPENHGVRSRNIVLSCPSCASLLDLTPFDFKLQDLTPIISGSVLLFQ